MSNECFHIPPCTAASVHHARTQLNLAARGRAPRADFQSQIAELSRAHPAAMRDDPSPASKRAARRTAFGRAPWELSAEEFAAVAEPFISVQPARRGQSWPGHRMFGLTVSTLRFGMRLRLVAEGGPEGGYLADVEWSDQASLEDPRRAFVADALAQGQYVPPEVLADYPELAGAGAVD
jgi:hypothetical protein